jgi:lipid II:glycine glycyltransferase (peptidoglycan interpeptide bridge formation enzyme)
VGRAVGLTVQTVQERAIEAVGGETDDSRPYSVRVSDDQEDSDWDAYLQDSAHGGHVQTSLWGQIKAWLGWRVIRIVVTDNGHIVAGAQILIRPVRFLGNVGYVPKGPVIGRDDPRLSELVIRTLHEVAAAHSIRVLFAQPSLEGADLTSQLNAAGFATSPISIGPSATVLVDLHDDLDAVLGRMTKGMRNGIRRSQRRGIKVREGTRIDLPTFHRLLVATSKRRGFSPFELEYFDEMWRILYPHGQIKLFLSEYQGESISAQLVIPFGDTVIAKQIGWSGRHGSLRPNEGLDWATIQRAKSQGFEYYDLEGIESEAARAKLNGRPCPESFLKGATGRPLRYERPFHGAERL